MSNNFFRIANAGNYSYCTKYCAKCRVQFLREFIQPLERLRGTLPEELRNDLMWDQVMRLPGIKEHLAEELESLPLAEFLNLNNWDGLICIAFDLLNDGDMRERILQRWIVVCPDNVRFLDIVIFHLLPRVAGAKNIRIKWVSKAVTTALTVGDVSLVESLIWRLGAEADNYPELIRSASKMSEQSTALKKALQARLPKSV